MPDPAATPDLSHYWVDNLNPFIIQFTQSIGLRWYGLAYLLGLVWGYWMFIRWARQKRSPLGEYEVQNFIIYAGLGIFIGGRVGYCIFYGLPELLHNPLYVIDIRSGGLSGMSSHGGILGLIFATWVYARRHGKSWPVLLDLIAATGPMGIALGRIANFINGELWGRVTWVPWAVRFPHSVLVSDSLSRDDALKLQIAQALPRHPSQLYAAFLEGFLLLAILIPIHARHRRPGLTGGLFCILYGCGRFIDEFFREPDVGQPGSHGVPALLGFMSKGQAYTLPLIAIGVIVTVWALRRPPRPELYLPPSAEPSQSGTDDRPPSSTRVTA
jgi:phosphatidylglycerol:prolipoprotein diacylglycerol transferase